MTDFAVRREKTGPFGFIYPGAFHPLVEKELGTVENLARAFSPQTRASNLTWGFAPGYKYRGPSAR